MEMKEGNSGDERWIGVIRGDEGERDEKMTQKVRDWGCKGMRGLEGKIVVYSSHHRNKRA